MKINTQTVLKNFNGEDLTVENKKLTLGAVLSNILLNEREKNPFNPLQAYGMAKEFYTEEEVTINEYDFKKLYELVEADKSFFTIIIGQVLTLLDEAKSTSKNKVATA